MRFLRCFSKNPSADLPPQNETFEPLISVERAKALSSNANTVSLRYHSSRRVNDDYTVYTNKVLGTGLSGPVVLVKGRRDGKYCAMKQIQKTKLDARALKHLAAEVEIYLTLDHPNIARLHDVYETGADVSLVMELCEGKELFGRLSELGAFPEADAYLATKQMLRAVGYLHAHQVVHRDLKLENFLYETKGKDSIIKLIDFGFAKVWDPSTLMMTPCGSIAYASPDVLSGKGYTSKCDLWSLGVIVFMLLVGYPPFYGSKDDLWQTILACNPDFRHRSRWRRVTNDAEDFVKSLLVKDPSLRLDVKGALSHRWLTSPSSLTAQKPQGLSKEAIRSLHEYTRAPRLKRAALQLLAQELDPAEVAELRECFLNIDKTNEGTILLSELKDAIRGDYKKEGSSSRTLLEAGSFSPTRDRSTLSSFSKASQTPTSDFRKAKSAIFNQVFDILDANGDKQIYYSEFLAATITPTMQGKKSMRAAFGRLDAATGDGVICGRDFKNALGDTFEGVNVELLPTECKRMRSKKNGSTSMNMTDFMRLIKDPTSPKACAQPRIRKAATT